MDSIFSKTYLMKTKNILKLVLIFCLIVGCGKDQSENNNSQELMSETPETLEQDRSLITDLKQGSYRGNIIERLYQEALDKNEDLKKLEDKIIEIKSDSISEKIIDYVKYKEVNSSYWNNAKNYTKKLNDSLLEKSVTEIFTKLESDYEQKISAHENKMDDIRNLELDLADQQILMKLLITQTMISNYQSNELPDIKQLESLVKDLQNIINDTKTYTTIEK
jgi:hypothetical protein